MAQPEDAEALVRAFAAAWDRCDIEGVLAMLAPDAVYQNMPLPAMTGQDEIRTFITPSMSAAERMDWQFLHILVDADGSRVMTERVDSFIFPAGKVSVPVMGIFEIGGGLILRWRDYADIGSFVRDMAAIGMAPGPGITA